MKGRSRQRGADREPALKPAAPVRLSFPPPEGAFRGRRVLLAGTGWPATRAVQDVAAQRCATVVGVVDSEPRPDWASRHAQLPLLGGMSDVERVIAEHCIDEIRVAVSAAEPEALARVNEVARRLGVPVIGYVAQAVEKDPPALATAIALREDHPSLRGWRRIVKRSLDIAVSGGVLLLLFPLLLLIAMVIKLTSAGPVLFHQPRIGLRRRQFRMLKFRTMLKNAEELRARVGEKNNARGISFKIFDDPRVTPAGAILRRTSLDELPQLINVLLGDMSLVGPRPIPVWVAEQMDGSAYLRRFSVNQGLTGLWQVEGRQQDFNHMATQDLRYVDEWSLLLDVKILMRTLPAVIRGEGAH